MFFPKVKECSENRPIHFFFLRNDRRGSWLFSKRTQRDLIRVPPPFFAPPRKEDCLQTALRTQFLVKYRSNSVVDGNFDFDPGLNHDVRNALHSIRRRVQVNNTLVDAHLHNVARQHRKN